MATFGPESIREKHPRLGSVVPSKDVSPTNLIKFVSDLPDTENYFASVYHHTIIPRRKTQLHTKAPGESRYDSRTPFPDPFWMLSKLASMTENIKIFSSVLVAPQMQTAYLAQQLVSIINESEGRFTIGLGLGWSPDEYAALGRGNIFGERGKILDQQIPALRKLLLGEHVSFHIGDEYAEDMAILPKANFPAEIWTGGGLTNNSKFSEKPIERAAKMADGWMPMGEPSRFKERLPILKKYLRQYGRQVRTFPTMGRIPLGQLDKTAWLDTYGEWLDLGISHLALTTTVDDSKRAELSKKELEKVSDPRHHIMLFYEFVGLVNQFRRERVNFTDAFFSSEKRYGESGVENVIRQINNKFPIRESHDLVVNKIKEGMTLEHLYSFLYSWGFTRIPGDKIDMDAVFKDENYHNDSIWRKNSEDSSKPHIIFTFKSESGDHPPLVVWSDELKQASF